MNIFETFLGSESTYKVSDYRANIYLKFILYEHCEVQEYLDIDVIFNI